MIKDYRVVRALSERVARAVNSAQSDFRKHGPQDGNQFVPGILRIVSESVASKEIQGLRWGIEAITNASSGSERVYDADLLSVFTLNLPSACVSTGFLARVHVVGATHDTDRLREQSYEMLERSNGSFVILLSRDAVRVVPAVAVLQSRGPLTRLYARSPQRFFEEHFECFLGDPKLSAATREELKALCFRCRARHALLIKGDDPQPELF